MMGLRFASPVSYGNLTMSSGTGAGIRMGYSCPAQSVRPVRLGRLQNIDRNTLTNIPKLNAIGKRTTPKSMKEYSCAKKHVTSA
jgi:hypothetical protein